MRGIHNENVERLRAHLSTEERHESLELEIRGEVAAALVARAEAIARFNAGGRDAWQARKDSKIHREAVGLRRNAHLDLLYPIPPP